MEESTVRKTLFRKETLERVSSPEQLTDYLRVTNPGVWAVLAVVILLLLGILAWASVGTLETTTEAIVVVENNEAQVVVVGSGMIESGMLLRVEEKEYRIEAVDVDAYGRLTGLTTTDLPDGNYEGTVVLEQMHPIDFLMTSR